MSAVLLQTGCGGALGASPSPTPTPTPSPTPGSQTFSISGTISGAGGAGTSVALSGTANSSTTADASGNYTFSGLAAGSYTVTPAKTGFSITPPSQNITITNANVTANFSSAAPTSAGIEAVNHIIFLAQENRSFDTYFGKLNDYRSAAAFNLPREVDGLPDGCLSSNSDWTNNNNGACTAMNRSPNSSGVPTTPIYAFHLKNMCIENTSPDWISSHWDFNAEAPTSDTPAMDGFIVSAASAALADGFKDTAGIRAMGFYTGDDLTYHYWLATQFATSDRWFSPLASRTQPSRYYMVGATSAGHAYETFTPLQAQTIFDLLNNAGISWLIYSQSGSTSAASFDGFMQRFASHIVPLDQFLTDAQSGNLPAVAYIEELFADEHPNIGQNIQDGVLETQQLLEAVMYGTNTNFAAGPSWKDSVFIITFDESGGLYDHVPSPVGVPSPDGIQPVDICTSSTDSRCAVASQTHVPPPYDPPGDFTRYGFRVPLMVISPFTNAHYVSHTTTDYTSWIKFVETRFGLPNLNLRDA
ncbi:MAG: alkaline phosphatase family protein, partial [Terriglobales bacterium]